MGGRCSRQGGVRGGRKGVSEERGGDGRCCADARRCDALRVISKEDKGCSSYRLVFGRPLWGKFWTSDLSLKGETSSDVQHQRRTRESSNLTHTVRINAEVYTRARVGSDGNKRSSMSDSLTPFRGRSPWRPSHSQWPPSRHAHVGRCLGTLRKTLRGWNEMGRIPETD